MLRYTLFLSILSLVIIAPLPAADTTVGTTAVAESPIQVAPDDWPWWRGVSRNGIATAGPAPPIKWSDNSHVAWKVSIPGRGHGSPSVLGTRVFIAAADRAKQTQSVFCFERKTGKALWTTVVHRGPLEKRGNKKS